MRGLLYFWARESAMYVIEKTQSLESDLGSSKFSILAELF